MPLKKSAVFPLFILAVGVCAVSISAIFVRLAQGEGRGMLALLAVPPDGRMPSLVIATWRMLFASGLLLPLWWWREREQLTRLGRSDYGLALLAGGMLACHFASWVLSLDLTTIASSTVLVTTSPIWVALASPFFLGEAVPRWVRWGIVCSLCGAVVIAWESSQVGGSADDPLRGNLLALVGAMTAAAYLLIGRKLRQHLPLLTYITIVYTASALILLLWVIATGQKLSGYSFNAYLICFLLALIPQLLGHTSFNYALGFLPAAYVTVTIISEPIGSTILAFLFFQLPPSLGEVIGGSLILLGIFFASRPSR